MGRGVRAEGESIEVSAVVEESSSACDNAHPSIYRVDSINASLILRVTSLLASVTSLPLYLCSRRARKQGKHLPSKSLTLRLHPVLHRIRTVCYTHVSTAVGVGPDDVRPPTAGPRIPAGQKTERRRETPTPSCNHVREKCMPIRHSRSYPSVDLKRDPLGIWDGGTQPSLP